jgi:hypothetical protein
MVLAATDTRATHVVRVREKQEYDIEVSISGTGRDAARAARLKFMAMTVVEQASNSVGVTGRTFETGEDDFDDDELAEED